MLHLIRISTGNFNNFLKCILVESHYNAPYVSHKYLNDAHSVEEARLKNETKYVTGVQTDIFCH